MKADLFYGLVGGEVFLEGLGPLAVGQHDVVGDGGSRSALGLHVGAVLGGQVEAHHQVALGNIHAFLHDAGGDQEVGLVSSELAEDLARAGGGDERRKISEGAPACTGGGAELRSVRSL